MSTAFVGPIWAVRGRASAREHRKCRHSCARPRRRRGCLPTRRNHAGPGPRRALDTEGLGHQRILRDREVVKRVVTWLSNPLARLTDGAVTRSARATRATANAQGSSARRARADTGANPWSSQLQKGADPRSDSRRLRPRSRARVHPPRDARRAAYGDLRHGKQGARRPLALHALRRRADAVPISQPYKLVMPRAQARSTVVEVGG